MYKQIPLRNRQKETEFAYVDVENYEEIVKYKWYKISGGYAQCKVGGKYFTMHSFVMYIIIGEVPTVE